MSKRVRTSERINGDNQKDLEFIARTQQFIDSSESYIEFCTSNMLKNQSLETMEESTSKIEDISIRLNKFAFAMHKSLKTKHLNSKNAKIGNTQKKLKIIRDVVSGEQNI